MYLKNLMVDQQRIRLDLEVLFGQTLIQMLIKIQLALMVLQEQILLMHQVIPLRLAKEIQAEILQTQMTTITLL